MEKYENKIAMDPMEIAGILYPIEYLKSLGIDFFKEAEKVTNIKDFFSNIKKLIPPNAESNI